METEELEARVRALTEALGAVIALLHVGKQENVLEVLSGIAAHIEMRHATRDEATMRVRALAGWRDTFDVLLLRGAAHDAPDH